MSMYQAKGVVSDVVLRSGRTAWIRSLRSTDAPYLIDIFHHLSSDSRYQRFNAVMDHLEPDRVAREAAKIAFSVRDGHGFLAFVGDAPIGGARYVRVSDDSAEIALSIRDDFQRQGLGKALLHLLVETARREGYTILTGTAQDSNNGMWSLLDSLSESVSRTPDHGFSSFEIRL